MEFLALALLAPLIWSGAEGSATIANQDREAVVSVEPLTAPRVEMAEGRWSISPPLDSSLSMIVVEHKRDSSLRSPASVREGSRRIDVIVSAP